MLGVTTVEIPNRSLFRQAEVCEIAQVQSYVLRSWEAEFPDLGVTKTEGGPRIYRRADVVRFHVETTGFGYQAELLTRILHEGRSYVEVPLVAHDREGSGSVNLRNIVSVLHSLLKIALRRLRVYLFK